MQEMEKVLGHEEVIKHLQNAAAMDKVSHSYIFAGEKGSGKKLLAKLFAMTLQCEKHGKEPCLQCSSCKKAMNRNHPDIIYVTHEKPNSIGIEDIREQLIGDVAIKPYIGPHKIYIVDEAEKMTVQAQNALLKTMNRNHPDIIYVTHEKPNSIGIEDIREQLIGDVAIKPYIGPHKIYIVDEAEKMTVQAQNALLKTIEEPPAYAVILLLVNNGGSLLPTISSRCVTLNFKPVRDEVIRQYLMEELHVPDYQAEISVAFAQGNVGKAKQIATAEDFSQMMESALRILKKSKDMEVYEMVDAIKTLSEEKHTIYEYLDLFLVWFRDVLMFKATHEIDGLVFRQEYKDIKSRADKSSYEGLENIIKAIENAKVRLQANVNFELTMELLFLTIREN